jgi:hypothetical protein
MGLLDDLFSNNAAGLTNGLANGGGGGQTMLNPYNTMARAGVDF